MIWAFIVTSVVCLIVAICVTYVALTISNNIKKQPKVEDWILASEPPKKHGKYLVTCEGIEIVQIRLFEGEWDSIAKVIAWQPLPKPYKSEG